MFLKNLSAYFRVPFLLTVILGLFSVVLPAWAQVTGINVITVPAANWALGSQNDLSMEFQFVGSGSDNWQSVTIFDNGSAQIGGGDNLATVNVWYQPSSSVFSPGSAILVGSPPAIDHFHWQNGPDNGAMVFNFPFTVGTGYYFMTLNIGTNPIPVTDLGPNETAGVGIVSSGVSFLNTGTFNNAQVANPNVGTVVLASNVSGVTDQSIPATVLAPGSVNNPVLGLVFSVTGGGTALFQDIQVANGGTAGNTDISKVKIWDQQGGGNFDPATAIYLGPLSFTSPVWSDGGVPFNWNVNTGDIIYVTVDIPATGYTNNSTCIFNAPSGDVTGTGFVNSGTIANPNTQIIAAPTMTPTVTLTPTVTPIPSDTPTPTPTVVLTLPLPTVTFTVTLLVTIPVATDTPTITQTPTRTLSPTDTRTLTVTPTLTPTPPAATATRTATQTPLPAGSFTSTPTPALSLYIDANYFNPNQGTIGMDLRVFNKGEVKVTVYNVMGEKVKTIWDENDTAGNYRVYWDGTNSNGNIVGDGVYIVLTTQPSGRQTRKVIVRR